MDKFRIACDVDDVLCQFYPAVCKELGRVEKIVDIWNTENNWVGKLFPDLYYKENFWPDVPVLSTPESINFEIEYYITSIPEHLHEMRVEWLRKNGFPDRPVICAFGKNKVEIMKELGLNVIIDDKPALVNSLIDEPGMFGIQFVPSYMSNYVETDPFTIKHLSQVPDVLALMEKWYNL